MVSFFSYNSVSMIFNNNTDTLWAHSSKHERQSLGRLMLGHRHRRWHNIKPSLLFNPLNPHDASKHHSTSRKNDIISQKRYVLEPKYSFPLSSTSSHLHQQQVEDCDSNSRLVVDEDDNSKFRFERVKRCLMSLYLCWDPSFLFLSS